MILHKPMLKMFIIIDHAIKTRLELLDGVMSPEQRKIESYKISGINEWRTLEKVAIEMMSDEWLWMPEVTEERVRDTLLFNYNHDREKQYETETDRIANSDVKRYVKALFNNSQVDVVISPKK